jgi:S1-C subfamily serine protease
MVSNVYPGSRAENDGIQAGDIFIEIEGQPVTDLNAAKDAMVKSKSPLKVKILRGKQLLTITLHLK